MGTSPHVPVLIEAILKQCAPVTGRWLDGTFGAGGYTRALLDAGATHVTALDRDPLALELAQSWINTYSNRISLHQTVFSQMDRFATALNGIVLDLGVSSMQLDRAERGFSFQKDGPLDMRMGQSGRSAADLVNDLPEAELAEILWLFGEERASRRIARAIARARPISRTSELAELVVANLPRVKPGQSHAATRTFQALRIAVNDEFGELHRGLMAAERALAPEGWLAVVTFHSAEDRMVKRFLTVRSDRKSGANRHRPEGQRPLAPFVLTQRKAIVAEPTELARNPRARSARLRLARRTTALAEAVSPRDIAMPALRLGHL